MNAEKKEAAPLRDAAPEENLTDESKILSCKPTCKKKAPPGWGWENGELVPFAPDESDEAASSELIELSRRYLILLEWGLADEVSPRLAAMRVVLGQDRRAPKEIAESLGVVPELIRLRIREARKVLASAGKGSRL